MSGFDEFICCFSLGRGAHKNVAPWRGECYAGGHKLLVAVLLRLFQSPLRYAQLRLLGRAAPGHVHPRRSALQLREEGRLRLHALGHRAASPAAVHLVYPSLSLSLSLARASGALGTRSGCCKGARWTSYWHARVGARRVIGGLQGGRRTADEAAKESPRLWRA